MVDLKPRVDLNLKVTHIYVFIKVIRRRPCGPGATAYKPQLQQKGFIF